MRTYITCIYVGITLWLPTVVWSQYSVSGRINLAGDWQPQVYLSTVDHLDNYYTAKAEHIVNTASIAEDGSFTLTGNNLPSTAQYYRLYLIHEELSEFNACLYIGGEEHNFVHLILHNESEIVLQSDSMGYAPFGDYKVYGDGDNQRMKSLSRLLHPSYQFHEIKFPSELRFSQAKLNTDLLHFADTCQSELVALAAMINTDFDGYYLSNYADYQKMEQRLEDRMPDHIYAKDYHRKLRYYSDESDTRPNYYWQFLTMLLAGLSIYLWTRNRQLTKRMLEKQVDPVKSVTITKQEDRILGLITAGKSNKEIASELYVEVSTVKSHINKLYGKLGVNNRREAIAAAEQLGTQTQ